MNKEDILNALCFLPTRKDIVLIVPSVPDIPYVKREIFHTLGEPRKIITNTVYYEGVSICILPMTFNLAGYKNQSIFYVGWEDNREDKLLRKLGFEPDYEPIRIIELWKTLRFNFHTMYTALLYDGYSSKEAVDFLVRAGVIV